MKTFKVYSSTLWSPLTRVACAVWLMLVALWCIPLSATPLVEDPKFSALSTKNGLSQDTINQMAFDQYGFLWLATQGGLNRFDGYRVNQIKGPNGELNDLDIYRIFFDSKQRLWIGTAGSGVYRYDLANSKLEKVIQIPIHDQTSWLQYANSFEEDQQGNLLISMDESVLRYSTQTDAYTTIFNLSPQEVENEQYLRFATQIDAVVFVAYTHGLAAFDIRSPERINLDYLGDLEPNTDNKNVKFLYDDGQNQLWVGTVQGLFKYPLDKLLGYVKGENPAPKAKLVLANRNIWTIKRLDPECLVLGTDIGLIKLNPSTGETIHILEPNNGTQELSDKDIYDIAIDKVGNFWLGSNFAGALYWSPSSLKFDSIYNQRLDPQNRPLTNNTVWALHKAKDNEVWVGTDNGLNLLNFKTRTSQKYLYDKDNNHPYSESSIEAIRSAPDGNLWLQTGIGLRLFDAHLGRIVAIPNLSDIAQKVLQFPVYGIRADNDRNLWFSDEKHFYRLDPKTGLMEELASYNNDFSAAMGGVLLGTLSQDSNDMLAGIHNSLWLIDSETKRVKKIHQVPDHLLPQRIVPSSWVKDSRGILWVAYPSLGIFGLDAKTFEQRYFYNADNILNTNTVYGLQLDEQENLWFSSHSGIYRLEAQTHALSHFRYGQELSTAEFNQGAYATLSHGQFAYGSPNGITTFNPNEISHSSRSESQLSITEINLSSRDMSLPIIDLTGNVIELEHDDVGLTINFSNMSYNSSQSVNYHYWLMEGNSIVVQASTRIPKVTFPTLSPGQYQFVVSTSANRLAKDSDKASLTIISQYAPWASPMAISLYGIALILVLVSWRYFRLQQRRRLDDEKRKVRLFGNAFSHTRDWVVIYDDQFRPIAANKAFEKAFGIASDEQLHDQLLEVYSLQPELRRKVIDNMKALRPGSYAKHEIQITNSQGVNRDVVMNVSAISNVNQDNMIDYFLFVITDITDQKNAERELIKVANYDSLTGLVNRSLFMDRLEHATSRSRQKSMTHAVLFIDLDRFKSVNDSLGHHYGDRLLQNIAKRMLSITSANDTVARMGGDEFVILIEDVEQQDHLIDFINLLIYSLESPITIDKEVLRISCSVGVSLYPTDSTNAHDLLKQADVAMYSAKQDNLVGFKYFTEELNSKAQQRLKLENQIKKAHQEGCFENHYQPIVDIQEGKVAGFELLMRCNVDGKAISPFHFIPVAEELRLIIDMTIDAIERGLYDLRSWYQQGFEGYLSVNLSALHFQANFDVSEVEALLYKYDLPVSSLRFEITESALMENTEQALEKFQTLRHTGFMLALDDFGTGYSSLSYLKKFPLQVLKIDKSFVDDIGKDKDSDAIVLTTLGMAENLNMISVAEGIETAQQVSFFRQHNCRYIQGYFYSKPVAADKVSGLLNQRWPTE